MSTTAQNKNRAKYNWDERKRKNRSNLFAAHGLASGYLLFGGEHTFQNILMICAKRFPLAIVSLTISMCGKPKAHTRN